MRNTIAALAAAALVATPLAASAQEFEEHVAVGSAPRSSVSISPLAVFGVLFNSYLLSAEYETAVSDRVSVFVAPAANLHTLFGVTGLAATAGVRFFPLESRAVSGFWVGASGKYEYLFANADPSASGVLGNFGVDIGYNITAGDGFYLSPGFGLAWGFGSFTYQGNELGAGAFPVLPSFRLNAGFAF